MILFISDKIEKVVATQEMIYIWDIFGSNKEKTISSFYLFGSRTPRK